MAIACMPVSIANSRLATSHFLKRIKHISDQILAIFNATGGPHQIVKHTRQLPLFLGDARMRHAARHLDETLDTTQRLGQSEEFRFLAKVFRRFLSASYAEREHAATHSIAVLFEGQMTLSVTVEAGIVDSENMGGCDQSRRDESGVAGRLSGTQM